MVRLRFSPSAAYLDDASKREERERVREQESEQEGRYSGGWKSMQSEMSTQAVGSSGARD